MKETEITVQVFESKEDIFTKLNDLGFEIVENYQLNDWYYIKVDNMSNMSYKDLLEQSILVRQIISDEIENQICYKNKEYNANGDVIREEKVKSKIDDAESVKQIFELAGLNNYCTIENNSFVFKKGDICFALQIVKDLGMFIEYEEDDTMPKNLSIPEKIQYMLNLVKGLGLRIGTDTSCKKVELMLNKKR